ncbi:ABC transporter ATP-binding protein [Desulfurococcaceae archaeon AG1]|nr:ABC transporter ATP-binding protein [Desulfurococcaceae archaeon AG1]
MEAGSREEPLIVAKDIWKIYDGGYTALSGVDLEIYGGEIHVLLGENGAGKTTLLKILSGAIRPSRGSIFIRGERKIFRSPRDALKQGISMAYQGSSLVEGLTAGENISIVARAAGINGDELGKRVMKTMEDLGYQLDLRSRVSSLSPGEKQALEVSIAINAGRLAVLMDEPTALMSTASSQLLMKLLREHADNGKALVITSHKIREVAEIGDRYTILKRGTRVATVTRRSLDGGSVIDTLIKHMSPQGLETYSLDISGAIDPGEEILYVDNASIADDRGIEVLRNTSFRLRRGEILAIVSIDGRGVKEICEAIYGLRRLRSGKIYVKPGTRIRYIPSEVSRASIPEMPVAINISMRSIIGGRISLLDLEEIVSSANRIIEASRANVPSIWKPLKSLSGGNARRVIAWREAMDNPDLLIVEEPTANLDIASSQSIAMLIRSTASRGAGVLVVTSELEDPLRIGCKWLILEDGTLLDPRSSKRVGTIPGAL